VIWSVTGFKNQKDPAANGVGLSHEVTWRKPGIYQVSARLGDRSATKQIIVGIDGRHLSGNPDAYGEFFYCFVTVLDEKIYFLPRRPRAPAGGNVLSQAPPLADRIKAEMMYRDFVFEQDAIYSERVLQRPHLNSNRFEIGVYAVFEDQVLYLGTTQEIDAALADLADALRHDAGVNNLSEAKPSQVFDQIARLAALFDPMRLFDQQAKFLNTGFGQDQDSQWVAGIIGAMFLAFENHVAALGVGPLAASHIGCLFGFNTGNATFSSRFCDAGLGISRHSTNMLEFCPDAATSGRPISTQAMLSDGSLAGAGGANAFWYSENHILVIGAARSEDVLAVDKIAVNEDGQVVVAICRKTESQPVNSDKVPGFRAKDGMEAGAVATKLSMPDPLDPAVSVVSVSEIPSRQRATGYTIPSPDQDGAGGGHYAQWLGHICPLMEEWDPILNPSAEAKVGQGLLGLFLNSDQEGPNDQCQAKAENRPLTPGLCWPVEALLSKEGSVVENVEGSLDRPAVFERFRGMLPISQGRIIEGTGLFALARTFNGRGHSEKPRVRHPTSAAEAQPPLATATGDVKEILRNTLNNLRQRQTVGSKGL
jgi:hypothetical protein